MPTFGYIRSRGVITTLVGKPYTSTIARESRSTFEARQWTLRKLEGRKESDSYG
jgi:hypothetical protein